LVSSFSYYKIQLPKPNIFMKGLSWCLQNIRWPRNEPSCKWLKHNAQFKDGGNTFLTTRNWEYLIEFSLFLIHTTSLNSRGFSWMFCVAVIRYKLYCNVQLCQMPWSDEIHFIGACVPNYRHLRCAFWPSFYASISGVLEELCNVKVIRKANWLILVK
jgi:hypothetical protein